MTKKRKENYTMQACGVYTKTDITQSASLHNRGETVVICDIIIIIAVIIYSTIIPF